MTGYATSLRRPVRGRRQARLSRKWSMILSAGLVLTVMFYGWYRWELRPAAATGGSQRFEIAAGQSVPQIATNLRSAGLIRNRDAFITYLNFHGLRAELKAGVYTLKPTQSGQSVAQTLALGRIDVKRLVVPEGSRLRDIEKLAAQDGIPASDFEAALKSSHTESFLSGKPASVDLEGYLFPDSYELGVNITATKLVDTMLQTFGNRVGPEYVQAFAAQGLTLHQGLTLASIVEREVNRPEDRPIVAQIFLKRFKEKMPLGSDVTVHYAADLLGVPFNVDLNSPYNTRRFAGLPPGPICSPGLSSLDAVAHPAATDYLYFLSGKDGKTYFAHTYAEHQKNIAKYLN